MHSAVWSRRNASSRAFVLHTLGQLPSATPPVIPTYEVVTRAGALDSIPTLLAMSACGKGESTLPGSTVQLKCRATWRGQHAKERVPRGRCYKMSLLVGNPVERYSQQISLLASTCQEVLTASAVR